VVEYIDWLVHAEAFLNACQDAMLQALQPGLDCWRFKGCTSSAMGDKKAQLLIEEWTLPGCPGEEGEIIYGHMSNKADD
jgi:hypothetical protein